MEEIPTLMVHEPTIMGSNVNDSNGTLSLINKHTEFSSFLAISNVVTEVMLLGGMRRSDIKRKTSDGFDEEVAIKYFGIPEMEYMGGVIPIPRRGRFGCKGCKGGKGQCTFNVSFTFDMRYKKKFLLLDTEKSPFCLDHNHPPTGTMIDGRIFVDSEKDLGVEEISILQTLALTTMGIAGVKDVLSEKFPRKLYSSQLMHRALDKIRDDELGEDRHQINELFKMGHETSTKGGVWVPEFSPDTHRICATHYQGHIMRKFALQYATYFAVGDGTHMTNKYRLIMCPFITSDCLGLSHLVGLGLYPSESSPNIIKTAMLLGISARVLTEAELDSFLVNGAVLPENPASVVMVCKSSIIMQRTPTKGPSTQMKVLGQIELPRHWARTMDHVLNTRLLPCLRLWAVWMVLLDST